MKSRAQALETQELLVALLKKSALLVEGIDDAIAELCSDAHDCATREAQTPPPAR